MAARMAVSYWRHYLFASSFELRWPIATMVSLSKMADLNPKLQAYLMDLSMYDCTYK